VRRFFRVTALIALAIWAVWVIVGMVASGTSVGPTSATLDEAVAFLYGFISFVVAWHFAIGIWAIREFRSYVRDDRRIPLAHSKPDKLR
jgi:hypothetical protein